MGSRIALIFVIDVLMFIDRVNISVAAKYIIPEYGLSNIQMSWVLAPLFLGMRCYKFQGAGWAIASVPGGCWLARFSGGPCSP
jgi:hypothetical protein